MFNERDHTTLWPSWIAADAQVSVWLASYDAALSAWTEPAMPLTSQGTSLLDALTSEPALEGAPVVLVGHSLGGLVIKTAVVHAGTLGVVRYERFLKRVGGAIFIATPHFGSELATLATALKVLLRTNENVRDLREHDSHLGTLNTQFRAIHRAIRFPVRTYSETRGIALTRRFFGLFAGPMVTIVSPTSGEPNVDGEIAIPLPEDHFSICKPRSRAAQIHKSVLNFLSTAVTSPISAPPRSSTLPESVGTVQIAAPTKATEMAFADVGIADGSVRVGVSVCIVTDEAVALASEISSWKDRLIRDPLLTGSTRTRVRKLSLVQLFDEPALLPQLLSWLSVTPFSGYAYYAKRPDIQQMSAAEISRRFIVEPLSHRIVKRGERIERIWTRREDFAGMVKEAVDGITKTYSRTVPMPAIRNSAGVGHPLAELAELVALITSRHLSAPMDEPSTVAFEHIRTRIRFAQDIATGRVHLRDRDPLA